MPFDGCFCYRQVGGLMDAGKTVTTSNGDRQAVLSEAPVREGKDLPVNGTHDRVRDRRIVAVLWLAMLAQGVVFALIQPVWSRVDEAQHFHYVQYLVENRALPVEGKTFISPEVVNVSLEARQWGWAPVGSVSASQHLDPGQWIEIPEELDDQERQKWVWRNIWQFNYEAMQPPLYYLVNMPVYAALPNNSFIKLYALRLLAALLASAMVPIAYLTAREAFPDSRLVVLGAPVGVLLIQGYALNMTQITNDALAVPLAAGAILLLLMMVRRGLSVKRSLAAGAVIGASLLAKLTTVFLLPVALAGLVIMVAYRQVRPLRALKQLGLIYATVAAIMFPWVLHNYSTYGDATGAAAARPLMSSFFMSPLLSFDNLRLDELLPTYWFGEPIYPFDLWTYTWVAVYIAMATAVIGLLYYVLVPGSGKVRDVQMRVMFIGAAFVIGVAINLFMPFGSGIGGVPGRYLYPMIPVSMFLILFGIDRLLRRERAQFVAEALLAWMVVWESINFLAYLQNR